MSNDYYAALGVSATASEADIKNAYREKLRFYHPDKWRTNPDMQEKAEKYTREINEAYSILSNPHKRARYDMEHRVLIFYPAHQTAPAAPRPRNPHIWKDAEREYRSAELGWEEWLRPAGSNGSQAYPPKGSYRSPESRNGRAHYSTADTTKSEYRTFTKPSRTTFAAMIIFIALFSGAILAAFYLISLQTGTAVPTVSIPFLFPW